MVGWLGFFGFGIFFFFLLSLYMKTTAQKQDYNIMLKVQMLNFRNIVAIYTHELKICKYAPFNDQISKLQIRTSLRHYLSHPAKKTCQLIELTFTLLKVSSLLQERLECAPPLLGHRRNPFALRVLSMLLILW